MGDPGINKAKPVLADNAGWTRDAIVAAWRCTKFGLLTARLAGRGRKTTDWRREIIVQFWRRSSLVRTTNGRDAFGAKDRLPQDFFGQPETKSGFSNFYVAIAEVAAGAPFGPRR